MSTVPATPTNITNVTIGTVIWPLTVFEVCSTRMRGIHPSLIACWATVNMPEITACEAMMVASVASTIIGTRSCDGTRR